MSSLHRRPANRQSFKPLLSIVDEIHASHNIPREKLQNLVNEARRGNGFAQVEFGDTIEVQHPSGAVRLTLEPGRDRWGCNLSVSSPLGVQVVISPANYDLGPESA
jgi:hypothetical protein